ncbi:MAG: PQQ-binding-like beta-propeller repeat protein [Gammaproteobacteria bacterium]|nr:PQQ-binding-like beta-propeller repeat protein [Gammaproteobacteria bacterium]
MFTSRIRTAWAGAGLLLTMITASPVWADDVELLLSTPASSNAAKPNILFIIDSSGSMKTVETSQEPFIAGTPYSGGGCDDSYFYWTTGNGVPNCGSQYRILKTAFLCQQGLTQIAAAGSYKDTMSMYRPNNKGKWKWRTLSKSRTNNAVECKSDSGDHGYGSDPTAEPYAQAGTNIDPYTSDDAREVDWGVKPTHQIVTMYDSDYLSWYHNPPGTSMSRQNIVKAVTKNVLGSVKDVNVGFMRFHNSEGGPVIHGIKDLDANRTAADAIVDGIPASGWTPLSETMYEAALYWHGMDGVYGGVGATDTDALDSWDADTNSINYKQPAEYSCSKNFVVLLTDGAPTQDTGAFTDIPLLPSFGRGSCNSIDGVNDSSTVNGACLDDVADYLNRVDINPALAGKQEVTTYTIGFSVDLPILRDTAKRGGGEYYLASDVKSLTAVLTEIVTDIFDEDISFTAPAVAVNAFNRTQHLNDLYVSVFRAEDRARWPGNLKKYRIKDTTIEDAKGDNAIDPDSGYFDDESKNFWNGETGNDGANVFKGGTANILPNPSLRKLYTNNGTGNLTVPTNHLSVANQSAYTDADFGLTGASGEPTKAQLIDWMRGVDVKDEDGIASTLTRDAMGDTLHSQPAAVVYGKPGNLYDVVIFNGTNDGYLHAINAETGVEKWSFVPRELLVNMAELYENDNVDYKNYGIDGDIVPVVHDANGDGIIAVGTDFVYLIFGMRRGGDNYYLVDVSNPDLPTLKWIKTYPEFGQSWSSPVVAKIDINDAAQTSAQKAVVILGGGYDTTHDAPAHPVSADLEGAGVYMLDLETGNMLWRAGRDTFANLQLTKMKRAIPSRVRVIDLNGDGLADRMYAADLGGQIWRFDVKNGEKPDLLVAGGVIARVGAEGLTTPTAADTRRLYTTPDVAMFVDKRQDRRYLAINIGTGYRAHPLDNSASDRFYSIRDPHIFNALTQAQYNSYDIVEDGDLVDVSGKLGTVIPAAGDGWKFSLPPNEKILSDSQTFDNSVYFVSFEPRTNSEDPCQAGLAANRLYRVNVVNGDPVLDHGFSVPPGDPEAADDARVTKLEQGGIAPKPTFFFPSPTNPSCSGDECSPPPVGCVGVECFDPGFANFPVRTLWTQDGID